MRNLGLSEGSTRQSETESVDIVHTLSVQPNGISMSLVTRAPASLMRQKLNSLRGRHPCVIQEKVVNRLMDGTYLNRPSRIVIRFVK